MQIKGTIERLATVDLALTGIANRVNQYKQWSRFFGAVSRLGDGLFWYALMTALILVQGQKAVFPVLHMIAVGLLGTLIYKAIKTASSRPRPFTREPRICLSTAPLDQFSFPSGHTLHAVCFTCVALHYYPGLTWLLSTFAILVALSRLILGLHYLTDVLAGAIIGGVLASISVGWLAA